MRQFVNMYSISGLAPACISSTRDNTASVTRAVHTQSRREPSATINDDTARVD
jgi:hypothetical protein